MWTAALTTPLVASLWIAILLISLCTVAVALWTYALHSTNQKLQRDLLDAKQSALSDPLTGLQNRRAWDQFLKSLDRQATDNPTSCTDLWMIVLDVDQFKRVNDQFGHQIGDQALTELSMRLRHAFPSARLFRIGGEEFAVVTKSTQKELQGKIERFLKDLRNNPMQCSNTSITLSCSAGAESFSQAPPKQAAHPTVPRNTEIEQKYDSNVWFHQADLAMYDAKRLGGDQAVIRQP